MKLAAWHVFVVSFFVRIALIVLTWGAKDHIDLCIYRDAGQLVLNKVNPYKFDSSTDLRQQLRTDNIAYNEYTCQNQERWDHFAGSNLPLSNYYFAFCEWLGLGGLGFRLFFALADSLLAMYIFLLFKDYKFGFKISIFDKFENIYPLIISLILSGTAPIFLYWGTSLPEHKGTGILMIIASFYYLFKKQNFILSGLFLGFSIAFIGVSAILLPCFLAFIFNKRGLKQAIFFSLICLFSILIFIMPYSPEVFEMALKRNQNPAPNHGSMWLWIGKILPYHWQILQKILVGILVVLTGLNAITKKISFFHFNTTILLCYLCFWLTGGSMDRMFIGLIVYLIVGLYEQQFNKFFLSLAFLCFGYGTGLFLYNHLKSIQQTSDGYFFALIYILIFVNQISILSRTKKGTQQLSS